MKTVCMIAEHHSPIAFLLQSYAERCDFQVVRITEGDRIMALTLQFRPQVIFIDAFLPGKIRGFTAIKVLKEDPETRDIPIVVLYFEERPCELAQDADICINGTLNYQDFLSSLDQLGVGHPIKGDNRDTLEGQ